MAGKIERVRVAAEAKDPCNGCHECALRCAAGVQMTQKEFEDIIEYLGGLPAEEIGRVTRQEKEVQWFEDITRESCLFLDMKTQNCLIYPVRPLICRLFGRVEWLPCPAEKEVRMIEDGLDILRQYAKELRQTFPEWQMQTGQFDLTALTKDN